MEPPAARREAVFPEGGDMSNTITPQNSGVFPRDPKVFGGICQVCGQEPCVCAPGATHLSGRNQGDPIPRPDTHLRLEALRLALGQGGGADNVVRNRAEAYLAFLKGEPAPED